MLRSRLAPSLPSQITSLLLQFIPMPVLYGVFLYMGVSSLKGIQVRLCVRASVRPMAALKLV